MEEKEAEINADNFTGLGAPIGYVEIPISWLVLRDLVLKESGSKGGKRDSDQMWVGLVPSPLTWRRAQGGMRRGTGSVAPSGCSGFVRIEVSITGPIGEGIAEDAGEVAAEGAQGQTVHKPMTSSFALHESHDVSSKKRDVPFAQSNEDDADILSVGSDGSLPIGDVLRAGAAETGPNRSGGNAEPFLSEAEMRSKQLVARAAKLEQQGEKLWVQVKQEAKAKGEPEPPIPSEAADLFEEAAKTRRELMANRGKDAIGLAGANREPLRDTSDTDNILADARSSVGQLARASDDLQL